MAETTVRLAPQSITFARESIAAIWDEALPLIHANQRETGEFPAEDFNPNRELYQKADELGKLRLFTMRDQGKLVGYQTFAVEGHPRYGHVHLALQDVAYVSPSHRGPNVIGFFRFAQESLILEGLKAVRHNNMKRDHSKLLAYLGFRKIEETWIKD